MLSIDRAKYDPERKRENVSVNQVGNDSRLISIQPFEKFLYVNVFTLRTFSLFV